MKNLQVYIIAAVLCAAGLALCAYKVSVLGLPLTPDKQTQVWVVEARVEFHARGKPAQVAFALPQWPAGFEILDENYISRKFGLALEDDSDGRQALWSIRSAKGTQALYYRVTLRRTDNPVRHHQEQPRYPARPDYSEQMAPAVETLLSEVRATSADIASFTRQLIIRLNAPGSDPTVELFRNEMASPDAWTQQLVYILAGARIPARVIYGLRLSDGLQNGHLEPWLEVHNEQRWLAFNPRTGESGFPPDFLAWTIGKRQLLSLTGGDNGHISFSSRRGLREVMSVARKSALLRESRVLDFSPLALPIHVQNVYAILLTIPLGAFLVVLLRNLVGIKTFGTFMPVLIALAFRETQLVWGLILFTMLIALGLLLRVALERMKLLLVPRLGAVLTMVILLMLLVSLASHQIGIERGLSVALFPMVILAMTIERMSVVWEEHGGRDAMLQGLGSLVVAAASYLVMSNDYLEHLVFVFPELLLVVLAATFLMGRYTGYRLTEFWRFRALLRQP